MKAMKTNNNRAAWEQCYEQALVCFLRKESAENLLPATTLGQRAVTLGLETLDVANYHTNILTTLLPSDSSLGSTKNTTIKQAETFFTQTAIAIAEKRHSAIIANDKISRLTETLSQRQKQSAASKKQLNEAKKQRLALEKELKNATERNAKLMAEAKQLQTTLRQQTQEALLTQEDNRDRAARELRDEIAQALIAIDLSLLTLRKSGISHTEKLEKKVAVTQQLVQQFNQSVCSCDRKKRS